MDENNREASEKQNFSHCFRPIYYFARVAGQMPFTITSCRNGATVAAKFNICDFIWLAISLGIHIYFIHWTFKEFESYKILSADDVLAIFNLTMWIANFFLGIFFMVLDAYNRLKIVEMLNKITMFDQEVCEYNEQTQFIPFLMPSIFDIPWISNPDVSFWNRFRS